MAEEETLADFDTVLKETSKKYRLVENKLRTAVREELVAWAAREIVKRIVAGEVSPPKPPRAGVW